MLRSTIVPRTCLRQYTRSSPKRRKRAARIRTLDRRIGALARTQELLSESGWHGGELAEIARREFAPYAAGNIDIGGPCITLKAEATQAVIMVLHELTTNAAKYGALSTRGGRVALHWSWMSNGSPLRLSIEWQEVNGPPVESPSRISFGTSTIRDLIPFELGGTVDLTFAAEGVSCRIEIPATWVHQGNRKTDTPNKHFSVQAVSRPRQ